MERLTARREDGKAIYACSLRWQAENEQTILDRLAELEDEIEKKKLIQLPCPLDSDVYYITNCLGGKIVACTQLANLKGYQIRNPQEFGYFVDRANAEEQLNELQNDNKKSTTASGY